jgi:hypothetical protein
MAEGCRLPETTWPTTAIHGGLQNNPPRCTPPPRPQGALGWPPATHVTPTRWRPAQSAWVEGPNRRHPSPPPRRGAPSPSAAVAPPAPPPPPPPPAPARQLRPPALPHASAGGHPDPPPRSAWPARRADHRTPRRRPWLSRRRRRCGMTGARPGPREAVVVSGGQDSRGCAASSAPPVGTRRELAAELTRYLRPGGRPSRLTFRLPLCGEAWTT